MSIGWLLIVILAAGPAKIVRVDGADECVQRSRFEMRYDPKVEMTYCHFGREIET